MKLEKGMLIISLDIDVGNKALGVINGGKYDVNFGGRLETTKSEYLIGKIEEQALPLIVDFFNKLEIPATFAIRGQLIEVDCTVFDLLIGSYPKHEIAAHSYYHCDFTKLTHKEADNDLKLISDRMNPLKIKPKSFIFPKNKVAHLDLLEKYGYECYRGYTWPIKNVIYDGMCIKKIGQLYDVRPSLYIGKCTDVRLMKKIMAIAIEKKLPFHVWFHPWNLGLDRKSILNRLGKTFFPLFAYAKEEEKKGKIVIETMASAVEKIKGC
jgi:peptidoglycan/xylan/chitin deacetylase (PgdA/CDA1 family)